MLFFKTLEENDTVKHCLVSLAGVGCTLLVTKETGDKNQECVGTHIIEGCHRPTAKYAEHRLHDNGGDDDGQRSADNALDCGGILRPARIVQIFRFRAA